MAESVKISNLRLIDLEPYVLGKSFTGEAKNVPRLTKDLFEKFLTMLAENEIAKSFFDAYDHYKDFYTTAVDFRALIPKEMQMEVFYAAKNGSYYVEVPSFCVYMVKCAWEQASGMPNMLPKLIPHPVLTEFFKKDYFLGGLTFRDVVCNVVCDEYNPVSISKPRNKVKDFTELYVEDTDMIAAVPNKIADHLDDTAVLEIKETQNGLESNGVLLRTMCGYAGAINSKYDLRELI